VAVPRWPKSPLLRRIKWAKVALAAEAVVVAAAVAEEGVEVVVAAVAVPVGMVAAIAVEALLTDRPMTIAAT
jgi:hypothetical protein